MVKVYAQDGEFEVEGTFNFGYIGVFKDDMIEIDDPDEIKDWDITSDVPGFEDFSDDQIAEFLTKYINDLETRVQNDIKRINDMFLMNMYDDMEGCGAEFWEIPELTVASAMPSDPEEAVYSDERMSELGSVSSALLQSQRDRSVKAPDFEAEFRRIYPMFNLDNLIAGIEPEHMHISDCHTSFQCSDKFGPALLCAAYDSLDEHLQFTDWHNF